MRRLGMLVMAIILITGCNAMQSNMEEAERLWRETEKNIQKWAISTNVEASPAEKPRIIPAPAAEAPQKTLELVEEPAPQPPAPTPEQDKTLQESIDHHEQVTLPQTEQPVESPVMIDWPHPPITAHRSLIPRQQRTGHTSPPRSRPPVRPSLSQPSRHRRSLRQRPFLTSLLTLSRSQQNSPQSSQPNPHPIQPPSRKQATPHAHAGQG